MSDAVKNVKQTLRGLVAKFEGHGVNVLSKLGNVEVKCEYEDDTPEEAIVREVMEDDEGADRVFVTCTMTVDYPIEYVNTSISMRTVASVKDGEKTNE